MGMRRVVGLEYNLVRALMVGNIWWVGAKAYRNPFKSFQVTRQMVRNFQEMVGGKTLNRAFKNNGKYLWDIYNPAWPSAGFNTFFKSHLHELEAVPGQETHLRRLLIAITKRCPLACEHCSEAATLYQDDVLSLEAFEEKIDAFVKGGVGQLVYSGGEPLSRFDDLLSLLNRYKNSADQWIYTSAYGLTKNKAKQLKEAGLNGAAISLDHHIPEAHNLFRGNESSFHWVEEGIKNLQEVGVFVSLNVCPSRTYVHEGYMNQYVELAERLNIPIVNILEPRAVGNYQDKDVELDIQGKEILEEISQRYNFEVDSSTAPSVFYPAAYRKNKPCGGGLSYLFLDYDGSLYPCPFCKIPMETAVNDQALCEADLAK